MTCYLDINFPTFWITSDIRTGNGCGPAQCSCCRKLLFNGVFVHYCNKCLSKLATYGITDRGNPNTPDKVTEDKQLWIKAPYMEGVKIIDIGKDPNSVEHDPTIWSSPFNSSTNKNNQEKLDYVDDLDFDSIRRENLIKDYDFGDDYDDEYDDEEDHEYKFMTRLNSNCVVNPYTYEYEYEDGYYST
jgi:hypothetical protein